MTILGNPQHKAASSVAEAFDFDFVNRLASGETIASISAVTITPVGDLANPSSAVSGTIAQINLSAGKAPQTVVMTETDDVCTLTGHGYSDGDTVRCWKAESCTYPPELHQDATYYVVSSTANTFQLSCHSGGAPLSFAADGEFRVIAEYVVKVDAATSSSPTVVSMSPSILITEA